MSEHALMNHLVLESILKYLDSKNLTAAAQVNRFWENEATRLIWRGKYHNRSTRKFQMTAPLERISRLSDGRRLWYTGKMHYVYLYLPSMPYPRITSSLRDSKLTFPNAKFIDIYLQNGCNVTMDEAVEVLSDNSSLV